MAEERVYLARKREYFEKLIGLIDTYDSILVVGADNVGSNQMQQIRRALRGKAVVLMGKNTMMRTALKKHQETKPSVETLLPLLKKNIGLVFVLPTSNMKEVKDLILANKVEAQAKAGAISPCDVWIRAGPTGMEPTQTAFLQALNIATKIQKGQIEIINDVYLIKDGDKVSASQATLLQKLNLKPFRYGLTILHAYEDGNSFDPKALDVTEDEILATTRTAVNYIAALSLETGFPTAASVPHSVVFGFKSLVAITLGTEFVFKQAEGLKKRVENPEAFAVAAPVAAAAPAAKKEEPKKEEPKEESEDDDFGGGGLFGDDDGF